MVKIQHQHLVLPLLVLPLLRAPRSGPLNRSHRSKQLPGIESLKEIKMVRSKQGSIRLQAKAKVAKDFPNLSLSEKMAGYMEFI